MEGQEIHHHLPEEIIAEILSKLSVKSLLRFKCVSKSWRCLISSKYFIKSYLENPKKNENFEETTRIISAPPRFSMPGGTIKACSLSSLLIKPVTRVMPLDFPINIARDILIVGSCNGLICVLVVDNYQFFLWNPCTRECKQLPDFFDGVNHNKEGCFTARHGFAFDESSGDYKIYVVFCMRFFRPRTSVARLYSLKADSWGRVESVIDGSMFDSGKFVSGKLHWRRDFPTESDWEIVTLDLKSETFGVVKQPNCLMDYRDPRFGILKGCLCLYFDYPRNTTIGFDIWIWNEYGVEDSWSRLLTISYLCVSWRPQYSEWHLATITPLFVSPNDEVLFTYGSNFFIYNPKDNWVRKLDTVDYDLVDHRDAHVHTESLVSLALAGGGGGEQGRQA